MKLIVVGNIDKHRKKMLLYSSGRTQGLPTTFIVTTSNEITVPPTTTTATTTTTEAPLVPVNNLRFNYVAKTTVRVVWDPPLDGITAGTIYR